MGGGGGGGGRNRSGLVWFGDSLGGVTARPGQKNTTRSSQSKTNNTFLSAQCFG